MGGFKLSQQTPATMTRTKGAPVLPDCNMSEQTADSSQQLRESQRALKRTRQHLQLQEARSRQLVTACAAKLRDQQAEAARAEALKERQFQRILQQLAVLQSKLKREQKLIYQEMSEREQLSQQQARELERLRRTNRRLLGKVTRLSAPCARCGTKPDSGISDCDEPDELAPKQAKTGGSPDSALASAESSDTASPPTAERGIMKTTREQRKAPPKTVTFSLSDEPREREKSAPRRPPLPLKPRLILPPSAHVNGATFGQPSIVSTISQLLGVELEAAAARQAAATTPAPLSAIPEDLESSREAAPASQPSEDKENVPQETTKAGEEPAPVQESNHKPKNAPRSRSNINLIMSEHEGVKIKDNFEEFKFEEDISGSVCSDTASERSADSGRDEKLSFDRRAGDGAESEPAETQPIIANYDKFLEQSGLSQKSIRTPKRLFTNHRSMLKPSDVKHRHRTKLLDGFTIEDVSPTSVRYYSEEL
ncbi:actin cytoskeleton-regulatory complex protein PAN1-like isoform X2 [Amphibalanus amphitrite]|uniref:actin cytoskeleton-regulatory complex protein PAN1-like isoform X2 n=1 Tax=Amphibalanus amphitrite TaxID=1232801 RepID=UPI001C922CAE|nr:actin cytoskeleton-regulatory complex protein PAN1-like isoform X2 [Amphibalanus amphitrite]